MTDDDEVDLLITAWGDRLPTVDFSPLDVMSRLRRVAHRLHGVRRDAFHSAGLSVWEFDVLAALRRAEPPHEMSPAELVRATMIGSAAMSNRLEHLVERGLVARKLNPRDGRSTLAVLTPDGAERVDAAMTALVVSEAKLLEPLSAEQRTQLVATLRILAARDDA